MVFPFLARIESTGADRLAPRLPAGALILHIWTAIALLGARYAVGF